jgi:serine/threonine-protein kinase
MPPEQLKNFRDVKPQSDIYALGMTAYSLLSGQLALNIGRNTSMSETIKAIFEQPTIPLIERAPHLPPAVCEIIDRALVKDPTQRWQSARAMRNALAHVAQ